MNIGNFQTFYETINIGFLKLRQNEMDIMVSKSYQYFSEAIDLMVNSETLIQERVIDAYHTYIKHVSAEELPAEAQYLFKFFKRCMEPRILKEDIDSHDARQIAKVILFITDEIKKCQKIYVKNLDS